LRPEELRPRQARDAASDEELRAIIEREFAVIGRGHGKVDGLDKASGRKVYTDDMALPGMVHGKILRSTEAHARIVSIDTSRAEALDGVHAVITGEAMPTPYCVIPWTRDEQALATDRVRFIGDAVAAVAAEDEDTANAALELIDVVYEPLRTFFDPEEALAPGDDPPIHDPKKPGHNGNITKIVKLSFGDVDALMDASDVVVEGDYYFEGTTHTPIEPHCAIGWYDPSGKLTVWSATQVPHYLHRELARVLDLDVARIRVVQPAVGGAFGGKSEPFDLEFCVAKLSQITGRPVKILYTREEVFYAHRGRHPMRMRYRLGAGADGKIQAVDNRTLIDGGAYASFGLVTTYYSGQLLPPPYDFPSYRFDSTRVYTNKPPCGPKRGHGSVQPRFAFEVQLDKLSETLGIDPIELRRRNFLGANTRTVNELRVQSNGFLDCLAEVERASDWTSKWRRLDYGRGVGVAGSCYISGTNYPIYPNEMPQAAVSVQVERSGRVAVFSGASEIGQGSDSMVAYVVAEELGVPLSYVRVVSADTDIVPVDLGAYSSRETFMVGNACLQAARAIRDKVIEAVAEAWSAGWTGESEHAREGEPPAFPRRRVALAGGWAFDVCDTERKVPIAEAFNLAEARYGTLGSVGHYDTPKEGVHGEYRGATIGASPAYSFTAHVAEVTVDPETGFVAVDKIWIAHDCGRALNPVLVEGQMEGSAYMGAAEAIMEEQVFKSADEGKAGLHDAPSLLDYRIPTSLDTPEMESLIVESVDPDGPYGAKEAGEGPLHPSIPAIANAIFDAVGVRMDAMPFNPPRVWAALQAAGEGATERWEACRQGRAPQEPPPGTLVRNGVGRASQATGG
jgi:4-hydroxybenzoyl-CoA reductase alpha subunit